MINDPPWNASWGKGGPSIPPPFKEEIYPALGPALLGIFLEELETVGYIDIKDGKAYPTAKGKAKSTKTKSA